jgi:hypothetical protein
MHDPNAYLKSSVAAPPTAQLKVTRRPARVIEHARENGVTRALGTS